MSLILRLVICMNIIQQYKQSMCRYCMLAV